jgi:hypothetical protein
MRPIIPPWHGGAEENPRRSERRATVNIRGLFSGSARRERDEAKRRAALGVYYTSGEIVAMTPEELEVAAQCISAGTCLCGKMPLFIDGAACPSCSYEFSRAIQGALTLGDPSIRPKSIIAIRRRELPKNARKKLMRKRSGNP